jgi:hypothetical protein
MALTHPEDRKFMPARGRFGPKRFRLGLHPAFCFATGIGLMFAMGLAVHGLLSIVFNALP